MSDAIYLDWLTRQQHQQTCRQLTELPDNVLDFSHNDYLGLSQHPVIIQACAEALSMYGTSVASSPLVSGHTGLAQALHDAITHWTATPYAMAWSSGYQLNQSVLKALGEADKDTMFLFDKRCHASLIDGVLASKAHWQRFHHNDVTHLTQLLAKARQCNTHNAIWVVTESVFSMDGDLCPLADIVTACQQYDAYLYLDEAHACGLYGQHRFSGLAEAVGLEAAVTLRMGTFSKALGSFGAWLVAHQPFWTDYLLNTARGLMYSTGLPPAVLAANIAAIQTVMADPLQRQRLTALMAVARPQSQPLNPIDTQTSSPIMPVIMPNNAACMALSHRLQAEGYWVKAIRPPTVPTPRLRLTLSARHQPSDLQTLLNLIETA